MSTTDNWMMNTIYDNMIMMMAVLTANSLNSIIAKHSRAKKKNLVTLGIISNAA